MEVVLEILWHWTDALVQLLLQPFYYISILFMMLVYRRQVLLERRLFHVRLHSWVLQTLRTFIGGLLAGISVSVVIAFLGISLSQQAVWCIWIVAIILLLFRVRYLCFAYSIGILGVIQFVLGFFPDWKPEALMGTAADTIRGLDIPALLALVAVLHLAEALLVKLQGAGFANPVFMESKRGKLVGGYQMQAFWPIPLFLLIPAQTTGTLLPWTPLLGGDGWSSGFSMAALPVVIGFSEMTQSMLPQVKANKTFKRLLVYSIVLLALSLLAAWWKPLIIAAALVSILVHEGLLWYSRQEEQQSGALFVHPLLGLKVLAVIPGSPAESLGILAGESIVKINGISIHSKEQMHAALRKNSAFCKLEVRNLQGESKFLQRAIYAGEHHQLGAILAPDPDAGVALVMKPVSIFQLIAMKVQSKNKTNESQLTKAKDGNAAEM
ncbi:PDZ domain-containing protein [Paenibacillus dokdonensis]|uniref:PDZ domain-containing protein n=1 Tax=Paenibacillus dokdonensis TaxID=2567944 RepID=A0ABU6GNZ9_9BACL|nr:PDZ domain-containing protein [Paenibacillus dokdonensis]MEC0241472.1 PDZ domain-containing protein [Paenibacillus dokdonensis]